MKHDRIIIGMAAVLLAAVLIGEIVVYTSSADDFSVNAEYDGDSVDYSVSVRGTQIYNVIVMENGMRPMTELYVYYDADYAACYDAERGPIGSKPLDQGNYVDLFITSLKTLSRLSVNILSADGLLQALNDDVSAGDLTKGLVMISGALPATIYTGQSSDPVFEWLGSGGRLYWAGNLLGRYVADQKEIIDLGSENNDYQKLFFGVECLNDETEGVGFVSNDIATGLTKDLRYDLSLKNNRIKYGIDNGILSSAGIKHRILGFSDDDSRYASITLAEYAGGAGMICVLAGDYSRNQRSDLVQVVSSGIDHSTAVIGTAEGSLQYNGFSGSIDVSGGTNIASYIYLGGYFPVYGRLFSF